MKGLGRHCTSLKRQAGSLLAWALFCASLRADNMSKDMGDMWRARALVSVRGEAFKVLTLYVLAGPLGQCHPIPDDPQLKAEMLKHARNLHRIHSGYNLPYQSAPGSDMAKVRMRTVFGHVLLGEPCSQHDACTIVASSIAQGFRDRNFAIVYHFMDKPSALGAPVHAASLSCASRP